MSTSPPWTRFAIVVAVVVVATGVFVAVKIRREVAVEALPATDAVGDTRNSESGEPDFVAALRANELSEEKQKHIWKVEHSTFELERWFGRAFRKALADRDEDALAAFLLDDAVVTVLPAGGGDDRRVASLVESQMTSSAGNGQPTDAPGLVRTLLESIRILTKVERTRLRVLALDTKDGNEWTSEILVECFGSDADGRRHLVSSHHDVRFTFSSDEEIKEGRILKEWHDKDRSHRSSAGPLFEEVTKATGLAGLTMVDNWSQSPELTRQYWSQVAVSDFNRDGYPDIAVASFSGKPYLLQSDRCQTFKDVTGEVGIQPWVTNPGRLLNLATWIDFDDDGWPDLLLGESLYRNLQGQRFEDVTEKSGIAIGHHVMGAVVADYDCDGLCDIYLLYQFDSERRRPTAPPPWVGDDKGGGFNQLWRNEGGGRFRDVTSEARAGGGRRKSFAATWHFLDDDHFPDLYIANDFGQNVHLRNRGDGSFEDVSDVTGTADFATSMGVCSGDLNNDGQSEIYVANMFSKMGRRIIRHVSDEDYTEGIYRQILGACAGNRLYTTTSGSQAFRETSELAGVNQVGWAHAPTMADFNADGLLDIYATSGFMSFDRKMPDG